MSEEGDIFVLYTDSSGVAVSRCSHIVRSKEELPVGFFSRILRGLEVQYSASEHEALAVVASINHFEAYTYGQKLIVRMDHKPNLVLISGDSRSNLNMRLRRFAL